MRKQLLSQLLLGAGLLLAIHSVSAQKIRSEFVKVSYRQLPYKPLPKSFKTCQAMINTENEFPPQSGNDWVGDKATATQNYLFLQGYEATASAADVTVVLDLKKITVFDSDIQTYKDPAGGKRYFSDVNYTLPATLKVIDMAGTVIMEKVLAKPGEGKTIKFGNDGNVTREGYGGWFTTSKDLIQYGKVNLMNIALKRVLEQAQAALAEIHPMTVEKNYTFYTAEEKKLNYTDLDEAQKYALEALHLINDKDTEENIRQAFQKAVVIWDKAIAEANLADNKARINEKVYKMLHYNCALAYMLSNDYEQAKKYGEVGKTFKAPMPFIRSMDAYEAEKDQKHIMNQIQEQESRYLANYKKS